MICYKIIDIINGKAKFLYHGVIGYRKRRIVWNHKLKARIAVVSDGKGTPYISGFHVFKTMKTAKKYLLKFRKPHKRIVKVVTPERLRQKRKGGDVYLVNEIIFKRLM